MRGDVHLGEQTREQTFAPDDSIYNGLSDEHAATLRAALRKMKAPLTVASYELVTSSFGIPGLIG